MKSSRNPSHDDLSLADDASLMSPKSVARYLLGSGLLALALSLCDMAPPLALLLGVFGLVAFGAR
jgi:hypothetical protein